MKFIKITNGKGKLMRTVKSTDYGFLEGGAIWINVEKLWNRAKGDFSKFTSEFEKTNTHELLHSIIFDSVGEEHSLVEEEKVVRQLTGEKWNTKLELQYLEDEK